MKAGGGTGGFATAGFDSAACLFRFVGGSGNFMERRASG